MTTIQLLKGDELIQSMYKDNMLGLDFGMPETYSWDMFALLQLSLINQEDFFVSKRFREISGISSNRANHLSLITCNNEARVMHTLETKSDGIIPMLYGSIDVFPLDADLVLENSGHILNSETSGMHIVDKGHEDYILIDLQNYVIPDRIYRQYTKALELGLSLIINKVPEHELMSKFVGSVETQGISYWETSMIQSHLYFGGIIDSSTSKDDLKYFEELFRSYNNITHLVTKQVHLHSSIRNPKYDILVGGHSIANMDLNISEDGKDWHWCNTHRLRFGFDIPSNDFNMNDALLVALILEAKKSGAETLNLGQAGGYDYKLQYKPEVIWKKGLRYDN